MLTVLNVAFPLGRVAPDAVGGAEVVLAQLDHALVAGGHRSIVIAPAGSAVGGELVALPAEAGPLGAEAWARAHAAVRGALARVLASERVDVVHLHGVDFASYLPPPGPPVLVTLHLPLDFYPAVALAIRRPRTWLQAVSAAQRAGFEHLPLLDVVPNGVDLEGFRPAPHKGAFALALGRICPEKGLHLALEAARAAGVPLLLAGAVVPFPEHARYFAAEIAPRLDRDRRYLGPVAGLRKRSLLARARCVVVPSLVPETTSLVALEALASGTPVVALRRGALADVVEHGRTGLLVDDPSELAGALRGVERIDPAACRRSAEARFDLRETVRRYLDLYAGLARSAPAAAAPRPRSALRIERVERWEDLAAVRDAWSDLWSRAPAATPFSHPGWLLPWGAHLAAGPPAAFLAWRGRTLAGVAPTFTYLDRGERVLALLGGGVSDYQDVLAEDGPVAEALLSAAAEALAPARLALRALPQGSQLLSTAWAARARRTTDDVCAVMALPPRPEELPPRLAPGLAKDLRWQRRRFARDGLCVRLATPATLEHDLDALFALHRARWESRGEPGLLEDPRLRSFHREAARTLLAAGLLRLRTLTVAGAAVGALLGFAARGRAYAYLLGVDPSAAGSPGSLLIAHAAEEAIREGARELDLLRGRESYKARWGAAARPTLRLDLALAAPYRADASSPSAPSPASA